MAISEAVVDLLAGLPDWFVVIFISMIPIVELRGTILLWGAGLFSSFGTPQIYLVAVLGNMIPIPFILIFFPWVEKKLRRFKVFERFFDWLFARTRKKMTKSVEKYEELALLLFVALPLPITGAWTGSLVAYLFGLNPKKSIVFIFAGVLVAGIIMLTLVLVAWYVAVAIIAILTLILVMLGRG